MTRQFKYKDDERVFSIPDLREPPEHILEKARRISRERGEIPEGSATPWYALWDSEESKRSTALYAVIGMVAGVVLAIVAVVMK